MYAGSILATLLFGGYNVKVKPVGSLDEALNRLRISIAFFIAGLFCLFS